MRLLQNPVQVISSIAFVALCGCHAAPARTDIATPRDTAASRTRLAFVGELPQLDGARLRVSVVEVRYGPGEASTPHSHPCPVIGYVAEGAIRTQTQGDVESVYHAGETFYEAPNGVHLISANASSEEPAKLIATFICDHDGPLTVDVSHLHLPGKKPRSR